MSNDEQKRHIVGAVRNNIIHHGVFEPVDGQQFAWRDGALYRLTAGASAAGAEVGRDPILTADEIYGMDDDALHARIMGEEKPKEAEAEPASTGEWTPEGQPDSMFVSPKTAEHLQKAFEPTLAQDEGEPTDEDGEDEDTESEDAEDEDEEEEHAPEKPARKLPGPRGGRGRKA